MTKKFNPQHWKVVKHGQTFEFAGRLLLRSKAQIAVTVTDTYGCEALAGIGHEVRAEFAQASQVTVECLDAEQDVFLYAPQNDVIVCSGEVFTNIDRMPMESGTMLEVKKALRELELKRRGVLSEIRAERDAMKRERAAAKPPESPAKATSEPEPDPDPEAVEEGSE